MGVFDSPSKYVTSLMVFLTAYQTSYKNEKINKKFACLTIASTTCYQSSQVKIARKSTLRTIAIEKHNGDL